MDEKIKLTADQVVSSKSGWVTFIDDSGSQRKCRKGQVEMVGEVPGNHPIFGTPESSGNTQPVSGEQKVATKSKREKKEATGVRTIGGKAVDLKDYVKVKTKAGGTSFHNGDDVAEKLSGKTLDEVYTAAARVLKVEEKELRSKYKHLNPGMQRMSLGNRMRKGTKAAA